MSRRKPNKDDVEEDDDINDESDVDEETSEEGDGAPLVFSLKQHEQHQLELQQMRQHEQELIQQQLQQEQQLQKSSGLIQQRQSEHNKQDLQRRSTNKKMNESIPVDWTSPAEAVKAKEEVRQQRHQEEKRRSSLGAIAPLSQPEEPAISKLAVAALHYAAAAAQQFETSFSTLKNPERENSTPLFQAHEILTEQHPLRCTGYYAAYTLLGMRMQSRQFAEHLLTPDNSFHDPDHFGSQDDVQDIETTMAAADQQEESRQRFLKRVNNPQEKAYYVVKFVQAGLIEASDHGGAAAADLIFETRILMNLTPQHPNICMIYGVNARGIDTFLETSPKDGFFLITDRVVELFAERLDSWREKERKNPGSKPNNTKIDKEISERLELALDIASALQFLHDRKIVYHLRPDKIGFEAKQGGRIKLCDFSQARYDGMRDQSKAITRSDNVPQVLAYTAPEVLCKAPTITTSCDVYAFGIILWELISLKRPFAEYPTRASHWEFAVQRHGRPVLNKVGNKDLQELISRCWAPYLRLLMRKIYEKLELLIWQLNDQPETVTTASSVESTPSLEPKKESSLSQRPVNSRMTVAEQRASDRPHSPRQTRTTGGGVERALDGSQRQAGTTGGGPIERPSDDSQRQTRTTGGAVSRVNDSSHSQRQTRTTGGPIIERVSDAPLSQRQTRTTGGAAERASLRHPATDANFGSVDAIKKTKGSLRSSHSAHAPLGRDDSEIVIARTEPPNRSSTLRATGTALAAAEKGSTEPAKKSSTSARSGRSVPPSPGGFLVEGTTSRARTMSVSGDTGTDQLESKSPIGKTAVNRSRVSVPAPPLGSPSRTAANNALGNKSGQQPSASGTSYQAKSSGVSTTKDLAEQVSFSGDASTAAASLRQSKRRQPSSQFVGSELRKSMNQNNHGQEGESSERPRRQEQKVLDAAGNVTKSETESSAKPHQDAQKKASSPNQHQTQEEDGAAALPRTPMKALRKMVRGALTGRPNVPLLTGGGDSEEADDGRPQQNRHPHQVPEAAGKTPSTPGYVKKPGQPKNSRRASVA